MKNLTTLILIISLTAQAQKTYYVSSSSGNDANDGTTAPIKTLNKLNSLPLASGDIVRLNRGDQFYGFININKSIRIATYGAGAQPVVTGFTDINSWSSVGNNLWESPVISSLANCNIVSIGEINTAMGRTPNTGYYSMSASGFNSATISQLTGTENYKGAELIARTTSSWITSRNLITSQSSKTLNTVPNYSNPAGYTLYNFGSQGFIQNALLTLDKQNEWYYNPSTKKLTVYSVGQPTAVRATSIDSLVKISAANVAIDSIDLLGANTDAIQVLSSAAKITNCFIRYCGNMGIRQGNNATGLTVTNCIVKDAENSGITDVYTGGNSNRTVIGNTLINISMIEGSGGSLDGQNMAICSFSGSGDVVQNNSIDSCGYSGIFMMGQSFTVQNNFINHYCYYNTDGGAIYTGNHGTDRKIIGNIILNGMTANAHGVYVDDNGSNVTITGNSISKAVNGIYLHNAHEITVSGNTVYGSSSANLSLMHDANDLTRNITVSNNIFVLATSSVNLGNCSYQTSEASETNFGISDNNYIACPVKTDINAWFTSQHGPIFNHYSLSQWQAKTQYDKNSKPSPKIIPSVDSLRFEYNATGSSITVSLGANYIDMPGLSYPGSITLQPYTSAVLIRTGAAVIVPPAQVFKNVAQSKAFIKNNCTSGTGSSVVYAVAAGKYSASTQAAADQLATTDINNNGQNYANLNGTCIPKTIIRVQIFWSDGTSTTEQ